MAIEIAVPPTSRAVNATIEIPVGDAIVRCDVGADVEYEGQVEHRPVADAVALSDVGCAKDCLHLVLRQMANELRIGPLCRNREDASALLDD